jgi:hypothetical protein
MRFAPQTIPVPGRRVWESAFVAGKSVSEKGITLWERLPAAIGWVEGREVCSAKAPRRGVAAAAIVQQWDLA